MSKTVALRVDANERVSLGHLKRCISLAQAMIEVGLDPVFLCMQDDAARGQLEAAESCIPSASPTAQFQEYNYAI